MKISLAIISIIIALQATSLLFSSQQRHNYHSSISQIHQLSQSIWAHDPCPCLAEQFRYVFVTIMYAASLLLLIGESAGPAFVAQTVWVALQSAVLCDGGIVVMIGSNIRLCSGCKSEKKTKQNKKEQTQTAPQTTQIPVSTVENAQTKKATKKSSK